MLAVFATGILGCGGGGGGPAQPSTPTSDARGTFTLSGAGYNVTNSYAAASGGHVFCRREDPLPNTIWIRLASSPTADGESGPHVDIDLCNFAGSATYSAVHDVHAPRSCSQGQTLGLWWHDGPSRVYVSRPDSAPCTVTVSQGTGTIDGNFECREMAPFEGTGERVNVTAGSFHCAF